MKKVFFAFVAVATIALVSCNNKPAEEATTTEPAATETPAAETTEAPATEAAPATDSTAAAPAAETK